MTAWNAGELDSAAQRIFQGMIPDMVARCHRFSVDTSEVDEELLSLFREHIGKLVLSLLSSVAGQTEPDIRRDSHSLLGMGGTIGVPTLSVVAEELSRGAKQGDYGRCLELAEGLRNWVAVWPGPERADS